MSNKTQNILGGTLVVIAFLYFITDRETQNIILGTIFILYGIIAVYLSFGKNKNSILFLGTVLFLTGTELLLPFVFTINYSSGYFATSVLFILGAANLMLFLDNNSFKFHLALGLLLIVISVLVPQKEYFWFVDLAVDKMIMILLNIWPVLLLITGIGLITSHRNKRIN